MFHHYEIRNLPVRTAGPTLLPVTALTRRGSARGQQVGSRHGGKRCRRAVAVAGKERCRRGVQPLARVVSEVGERVGRVVVGFLVSCWVSALIRPSLEKHTASNIPSTILVSLTGIVPLRLRRSSLLLGLAAFNQAEGKLGTVSKIAALAAQVTNECSKDGKCTNSRSHRDSSNLASTQTLR